MSGFADYSIITLVLKCNWKVLPLVAFEFLEV